MAFFFQKLKNLRWLDWVKIIVAIDITAVGIGLIFGFPLHIFANMFGWVSRLIFGFLYIFTAFLIFSRTLHTRGVVHLEEEKGKHYEEKRVLRSLITSFIRFVQKVFRFLNTTSEKILDRVDEKLDEAEYFLAKRKEEVTQEIHDIIEKKD